MTMDAMKALHEDLRKTLHTYLLQAAIFQDAVNCLSVSGDSGLLEDCKKERNHIPLLIRPTESSYEERCTKLDGKSKDAQISETS